MLPEKLASCCVATLVSLVAGCGKVLDPMTGDAAMPDAWLQSCMPPEPPVTRVESEAPGYGNSCVHGSWNLQALNGMTMPPAPEQAGHTAAVRPTAIAPGFNTLDSTSTFAIHVTGSGQENVGGVFSYAQLFAPLNAPAAGLVGTVDASAYTGVQFDAIVNVAASGARLRVANLYTDPSGGMCSTSGGASGCYDHPGAALAPSTTWTSYQVPFATLTQVGFGNPSPIGAAFPSSAIVFVRWDINIPITGPTQPWELWIDNVTFY